VAPVSSEKRPITLDVPPAYQSAPSGPNVNSWGSEAARGVAHSTTAVPATRPIRDCDGSTYQTVSSAAVCSARGTLSPMSTAVGVSVAPWACSRSSAAVPETYMSPAGPAVRSYAGVGDVNRVIAGAAQVEPLGTTRPMVAPTRSANHSAPSVAAAITIGVPV
jgi:hypothetical protein